MKASQVVERLTNRARLGRSAIATHALPGHRTRYEAGLTACTYCTDQKYGAQAKAAVEAMERALQVVALDPQIRAWLLENDPNALAQVQDALNLAGVNS